LAGPLLGFTQVDRNSLKGVEGLERVLNPYLTGESSKRPVYRDARGRIYASYVGDAPENRMGLEVRLTIDSEIQRIVENALDEKGTELQKSYPKVSGCAMVMDPKTGRLLAMASWPSFDPNFPASFPPEYRLNTCLATMQEPGSIMKPFPFAAAIEEKKLTNLEELFNCSSYSLRKGRMITDISPGYGYLKAKEILIKSSNPGIVQVGLRVGKDKLYHWYESYGFGKKTFDGLFPEELSGKFRPMSQWTVDTMGSAPMGYEIGVTPMQMAMAYGIIANDGVLMHPMIVDSIRSAKDGEAMELGVPRERWQVFSPKTAMTMRGVLREAVMRGTGRHGEVVEYAPAGKTGTANMLATPQEFRATGKAYSSTRHMTNFVMMAPYDSPEVVISVSFQETGKYGGEVAAPVAKTILTGVMQYLGYPKRRPADELMVMR